MNKYLFEQVPGKTLYDLLCVKAFFVEKINHRKSGNVSFLLHDIYESERKKWQETHSNYREVSKEVFEKLQSQQILPETLFNNLSASFPDVKSDALWTAMAVCDRHNPPTQSLDKAESTDLTS